MEKIVCLVILSGKRHTGKDLVGNYIVDQLKKKFDINVEFLHASNILKRDFTKKYELDYERILIDRSYKEKYREELTEFYNKTKQYKSIILF